MAYTKIYKIDHNVDYSPGGGIIELGGRPIVALHVVRELKSPVEIFFLGSPEHSFLFEPSAFVVGGIYNYAVSKIIYRNNADYFAFYGCTEKIVH